MCALVGTANVDVGSGDCGRNYLSLIRGVAEVGEEEKGRGAARCLRVCALFVCVGISRCSQLMLR